VVFEAGGGGENVEVGAASFGIGIDLDQLARDFDRAEQLARTRSTRIQEIIGRIRIPAGAGDVAEGGAGGAPTAGRRTRRRAQANDVTVPPPNIPSTVEVTQIVRVRRVVRWEYGGRPGREPGFGLGSLPAPGSRFTVTEVPTSARALPESIRPPQLRLPGPRFVVTEVPNAPPPGLPGRSINPPQLRLPAPGGAAGGAAGGGARPGRTAAENTQQAANDLLRRIMASEPGATQSRYDAIVRQVTSFFGVAPNVPATEFGIGTPPGGAGGRGGAPGAAGGGAGGRAGTGGAAGAAGGTGNMQTLIAQMLRAQGVSAQLANQYAATAVKAAGLAQQVRALTQAFQAAGVPQAQATRMAQQLAQQVNPAQPAPGAGGRSPLQRALSIVGLGTPSGLLRAGLAITGIGAGLNIAASISHRLNEELVAVVASAERAANLSRQIGANFNAGRGGDLQGGLSALANDRTVRGTTEAFQESALALQRLNTQYGLSTDQVTELVRASGQLARIQQGDVLPNARAIGAAFEGNAEGLQDIGLHLLDSNGKLRSVGLSFSELTERVGRTRAQQILYSDILRETAAFQERARSANNDTADSLDRISRQADQARNSLVQLVSRPFSIVVRLIADTGDAVQAHPEIATAAAGATAGPLSVFGPAARATGNILNLVDRVSRGQVTGGDLARSVGRNIVQAVVPAATPLIDAAGSLDTVSKSHQVLAASAAQAERGERGFTSIINDAAASAGRAAAAVDYLNSAIARFATSETLRTAQSRIGDLGTVIGALEGPFGEAARSPEAIAAIARARAQRVAEQANVQTDALTATAGGTENVDPAELARQQRIAEGETERARARIRESQAQAAIDVLDANSQDRRLSVQNRLNELQQQQLNIQDAIAPALLREAEIRDQITLASRENLDLTEARIRAEQSALPAQRGVEDINFAEQQAQLRATVSIVHGMQGEAPQFDVNEQIQTIIRSELARPGAELAALDQTRRVTDVTRAQQDDELRRQLGIVPLQRAERPIEEQVLTAQAAERTAQEQAAAIERALQSSDLGEGPQRTALQQQLNDARRREAIASGQIANAQAEQAGLPPIEINVQVDGAGLSAQEIGQQIGQEIRSQVPAVIDALIAAKDRTPRRISTDVPGAR
jgi:hypothetical protein